jgi:hypothetical protein
VVPRLNLLDAFYNDGPFVFVFGHIQAWPMTCRFNGLVG